jgi:SpoVK/Ycf46/Vps4 family AAA+-type ATPase
MAATNRPDVLDPALLRPGRFDRRVTIDVPDRGHREAILAIHAKGKPLAEDIALAVIAERTPGFSGADLANLLNEAAILATRYKKNTITKNEVNEAVDRIIGGIAGSAMEDTKNKRLIIQEQDFEYEEALKQDIAKEKSKEKAKSRQSKKKTNNTIENIINSIEEKNPIDTSASTDATVSTNKYKDEKPKTVDEIRKARLAFFERK